MVVALLALLVATSGTAYAALVITGADVKNGSLRSADLANGARGVQSRDVKDGSLGAVDLSAEALAGLKGNAGATGATGTTGPAGATGATGPIGAPGSTTTYAAVAGPLTITGPSGGNVAGAPSITVTVPTNGLVQVVARATVINNQAAGYMNGYLIIDNSTVSKQFVESPLNSVSPTSGMTSPFPGFSNPTNAPEERGGGAVIFLLSPGQHTVSIGRASNDFGRTGTMTNMRLWVTVLTPS